MKNIVLIGFMGSGKTTVAIIVAKKLNMPLVKMDDIVEEKAGMPINDIFEKKGESCFRRLEREAVIDVSSREAVVIDTGGGVVINDSNVSSLKANGILFCLDAVPDEIYRRVGAETHRPLLNTDDPLGEIKRLLEKRRPYYEKADYRINTAGKTAEKVAEEIIGIYSAL